MTELILRLSLHDERVLHALVARRRPRLDALMRTITHLGGSVVTIGLALVMVSGVLPWLETAGSRAAFALTTSFLAVQLLKRWISRPRPRLPVGLDSLAHAPDRFSFPSGHSAASLSVTIPLATALGGILGLGILALGLAVGFSRAYLGVHYPGDVVAGWALSILALLGSGLVF
jgi:undecaprenyl-diphosphatase